MLKTKKQVEKDLQRTYDKIIEIQRQKVGEDENGISVTSYEYYKKAWANVNNLHGKEYWNAREYGQEATVEFSIPYNACPDIKETDRIAFNGDVYDISFIDNIQYKNEDIKIKAVRRE